MTDTVEQAVEAPPAAPSSGELPPETYHWPVAMRYIAAVCLIIGGVLGLLLLLPIIQVLFIAFVISFLMYIPSRFLSRRLGLSFTLAVALLYLVGVLMLVTVVVVGLPALIREINNLWVALGEAYAQFVVALENYQPGDLVLTLGSLQFDFDPLIQPIRNFILPQPEDSSQLIPISSINLTSVLESLVNIAGGAVYIITSIVGSVAGFLAAFFLAFLISLLSLIDLNRSSGFLFHWVPPVYRREIGILLRRIDQVWLSFFKGQVIVGSLLGVLSYIQFTLMGVPGALPLAIQNAFISLIPNIGGIISMIPVVIVSLLGGSTVFTEMSHITFTLLVVVIAAVYSQVIYTVVAPVIVGKSVNLPVVFVIVGVIIGFALGGVLGALLVVPLLSTIRIVTAYVMAKIAAREPFPGETLDVSAAGGFITQVFLPNDPAPVVSQQPEPEPSTPA